jgi:excisionase family DNA binding protein
VLTRAEVAKRLRVHEHTVDRYIRRGLIKAIKSPSGIVRIEESALDEYLRVNVVVPDAEQSA